MTDPLNTLDVTLSPEMDERVDAACDRFEDAWKEKRPLTIEEVVGDTPEPERSALLHHLILLDVDYRRRNGQTPRPEDYQKWLSTLGLDWFVREFKCTAASSVLRYQLADELGRGGVGLVRRGYDLHLGRELAVKELLEEHRGKTQLVQRFLVEPRIGARLQHPGIVPVYDRGVLPDRRPFFTMKLVQGRTLADLLKERTQPDQDQARFLGIFEQIAQTMAYAHANGVIHRDLKPANVMVGEFGEVQVMDWGFAKVLAAEQRTEAESQGAQLDAAPAAESDTAPKLETERGQAMGTWQYMPPEQARGEIDHIDERSDVFGLGAILCEILTRRPPFTGQTVKELSARARACDHAEAFAALDHSGADVDLVQLTKRCLAADRQERPRNASEAASAMTAYLTSVGERTRAAELTAAKATARAASERKARHLTLLLVVAAALLPLLVAVVASIGYASTSSALAQEHFAWGKEAEQRQLAEHEKLMAEQEREKVRQERDKLNGLLYLANMPRAQRAQEAGDLVRLRTILDQHRPQPGWTDPRGWEWFYLNALSQGELLGVRGHSSAVLAIAFAPEGHRLASADNSGTVKIWDVDTSKELASFRAQPKGVYALSWDPDGKRLALVGGDGTVQVWDAATGKKIVSLPAAVLTELMNVTPAWSPDGKRLATGDKDGSIRVWDAATGKEGLVLPAGGVLALAWSPDGKRLASFGAGLVKVWDVATGEQAFTFWELQQPAMGLFASSSCALTWSQDSKRVLATLAKGDGIAKAWDAATGALVSNLTLRPRQPPNGQLFQSPFSRLVWSPDGKRLASVIGSDGPVQLWDATSGEEILSLGAPRNPQNTVSPQPLTVTLSWSLDGRRLARTSSDGSVIVWEPSHARRAMRTVIVPSVSVPAWTPDGRQFFGAGADGTIRFWDAATGEMTRTLGADTSPLCAAAWSADGRRLATANRAGVIEVRDAATGRKTLALSGNTGPVAALVWSHDDRKLAASGEDRTIRVWDLATSKEVFHRELPGIGSEIPVLTWSFDSRWLMVRTPWPIPADVWLIEVWDANTGRRALDRDRMAGVHSALWSPTGGRLATLSAEGTVKVWEPENGREIFSLKTTAAVLAWEADGKRLAALCREGTVQIWDAVTGDERFNQQVPDTNERPPVLSGFWSRDGRRLALTSPQGTIRIWESATGKNVLTLRAPAGAQVAAVWSPDGRRLASTSTDGTGKGTVQVWNLADGKEVFHLDGLQRHPQLTGADWLSWSPDGGQLAGALVDGTISIWDGTKGTVVFSLGRLDTLQSALGPGGRPTPVSARDPKYKGKTLNDWLLWSPNSQKLAVVSADGTIPVQATATGKEAFTLAPAQGAGKAPESLALVVASLDGRSFASSSSAGAVKVWQAATGYETRVLEDAPSPITSFAWSPDGARLAWRRFDNKVQVSDANGQEIFALRAWGSPPGQGGSALLWSPDGKRLASSGPGGLQVWNMETGAEILGVRGSWGRQRDVLAWSQDGGRLAAVGNQSVTDKERVEEVKIWDAATGKVTLTLRSVVKAPRVGPIVFLDWSADGRWLAAARTDGLIKVWETATGKESLDLPASAQGDPPGRGLVPRFAWNSDSRRLAAVTSEGTIRIHDVVAGKEVLTLGGQAGQIAALAWSPDGKALASGTTFANKGQYERAAEVNVWDGANGKEILTRALDKGPVYRVIWSQDGLRLAAASNASNKAEVRVWEVSTGKEVLHVDWAASNWWLAWAPGGKKIVGSTQGSARVWDLSTGKATLTLTLPHFSDPRVAVAWNADGKRLIVPSADWTLRVWDATTGKEALTLGRSVGTSPPGIDVQNLTVLAWRPDGKQLATAAPIERTIKVWDVATGKVLITFRRQEAALRTLAWDPDGKWLASADEDAMVKIWDSTTGELLRSFEYVLQGIPGAFPSKPKGGGLLAWRKDGRQLAMAGEDNAIRIWDTTTGEKTTYYGHSAPVSSAVWSPDGKRLASVSDDGTIKLWDATLGQEVFSLHVPPNPGQPIGSLAWSPDGWQLALFRPTGNVTVWDGHSRPD